MTSSLPQTLGQALSERASATPDRLALVGGARSWTWAALDAEVDRAADLLAAAGLSAGEVLGLLLRKRPEVVVAFLAVARLGALIAPLNYKLHPTRLAEQLAAVGPRLLLTEAAFEAHLGGRPALFVGEGAPAGAGRWGAPAPTGPRPWVGPDTPVYLNTTSGTTGEPKAALTTHGQILANAALTNAALGFGEEEVFLGMFSVFAHPHELFHRCLLTGATAVILDTLSPRITAAALAQHRVTWMMAVPSLYEMMLDHLPREPIRSLRVMESGGAVAHPGTRERVEAALGGRFVPVWGSTETVGVALVEEDGGARIIDGYEGKLVGRDGSAPPAGEQGELWLRGPGVVRSYWGGGSEGSFSEGWYRTGDLFRRLDGEHLRFCGRITHMMKVGGIRVHPLEIERVLLAHPAVREAAVLPDQDQVRGEVPRAVVSLSAPTTPAALLLWCRGHLAGYKVPRKIEIVDDLPKLPSGKIDRVQLLEEAGR
ncbi:MAG: acyl--CoA ligase [Deltaproteobacteria bacterium]|nr:acyl--CoA ligase [Deltaproteobacteria bacterium]